MCNFVWWVWYYLKNICCWPSRIISGGYKTMGSSDSKHVHARTVKELSEGWLTNIKILISLLKAYMKMTSKAQEQEGCQLAKNVVERFMRADRFELSLKRLALEIFPQTSDASKQLQSQVEEVSSLKNENTRLKQEKQYLIEQSQKLNNEIKERDQKIEDLKEAYDKQKEQNENLNVELYSNIKALEDVKLESDLFQQQLQEIGLKNQNLVQDNKKLKGDLENLEKVITETKQTEAGIPKPLDRDNVQEITHQTDDQQLEQNTKNVNEIEAYQNKIVDLELMLAKLKEELTKTDEQTKSSLNNEEVVVSDSTKTAEKKELFVEKSLIEIADILKDSERLDKQIDDFCGSEQDKKFLHLKELLIRNVVKLDDVEAEGHNEIRQKRKEAIQFVQQTLHKLEAKAKEHTVIE